jgi:divinyl protochlorophyllide a 8-vinyl-reductase
VPTPPPSPPHRIGALAVTELGAAFTAHGADRLAREIFLAAGHPEWLARPPARRLPVASVVALHDALHRLLPEDEARAYAREAGMRTADRILAHRIAKPARMVLRLMPPPVAARLLLGILEDETAAFAGSGGFAHRPGTPLVLEITANPLARRPGCDWHAALFRRLFQSLVDASAEVRETACCAAGAPACRFEVTWRATRLPPPART